MVTVQLTIERVVAGGDGLARGSDGRVVFVPGTLPGEVVEVEIVSAKRDFARARLIQVVEPHPGRVRPTCSAVARGCGGCDWQHADATTQMSMKVEIVREALARTGGVEHPVVAAGGAVDPWGYRTTMRFALDRGGRAGLRRARSNDLVLLDACPVAASPLSEMLPALRCHGADEVTVRTSTGGEQRTVVVTPASASLSGLPAETGTGDTAAIVEVIAGVPLRVSAGSFFQSGPQAAELLVDAVRDACGDSLDTAATVIDAYAGIGLFGATIVPARARLVSIESSSSSCADALVNLDGHSAQVVCELVEDWLPEPADLVIADPSRQGLGAAAVAVLAATGAPVMVLVSCDPAASARDTGLLRAAGYRPTSTVVLDLFPQTHHVESVTRFERCTAT